MNFFTLIEEVLIALSNAEVFSRMVPAIFGLYCTSIAVGSAGAEVFNEAAPNRSKFTVSNLYSRLINVWIG